MTRAAVVLACLVAAAGCKKKAAEGPPPDLDTAPPLPAAEMKRGQDACQGYIDAVCACTVPAAAEECKLAKVMTSALQLAKEVSMSSDSKRRDVLQANDSARKMIAKCIEHTAKLPSLGC